MAYFHKFEANIEAVSDAATAIATVLASATSYNSSADSFSSNASSHCNGWDSSYSLKKRHKTSVPAVAAFTSYTEWKTARDDANDAVEAWLRAKSKDFNTKAISFKKNVSKIKDKVQKLNDALIKINEAITTYEDSTFDLDEAKEYNNGMLNDTSRQSWMTGEDYERYLESLKNQRIGDELSFQTVGAAAGGQIMAMITDAAGNIVDLASGVKATYGYSTTTTSTAMAVVALGRYRGYDDETIEKYQTANVEYQGKMTDRNISRGYYDTGGATRDKAKQIYESTFDEPYTPENVQRRLDELQQKSGLTDAEKELIFSLPGMSTNSSNIGQATSVLANLGATVAKVENRDVRTSIPSQGPLTETPKPANTPTTSNTPTVGNVPSVGGGRTSSGGTSSGGTSHSGSTGYQDLISTAVSNQTSPESPLTPIPSSAPSITKVSSDSVPSPIASSTSSKYIDQQASEIFYGRNPEQIAADRANALSVVDQAFNGEGVEEFKDVLKKGGFDDVDINVIMENKEIAVTAYILATESKSLTDIANNLAMANNIANFDTMYDNGLSRMSLENGLSQSKLMAEVNEEVADARTNLKNARENYNNSVKKANDSIEDANKKKEEMEELKKKIVKKSGEDTSKWEDEDVEAYNKAVEKYNEANKAANEAHKEAMSNKELMDDAEQKLSETEERVAKEYLEQQNQAQQEQQMREEVPIEQPIDQPVEQPELQQVEQPVDAQPVENDPGTIQTDDLVVDNNVEVEPVNNKGNFVSPDDVQNANSNSGSNGANAIDNVEPERKLTSDDIMDLIGNLEDVSNVSTSERTLDAVDLSSLAPDDRTIPNLGLNTNFDSSSSAGDVSTVAREINIPGGQESVLPQGNSLVGFADKAAQDANKNTDDFQNNRFNAGNFSMNAGSMNAISTQSTSSSSTSTSEKKDDKKVSDAPVVRDDREETVAGIKIESSDIQRHTDGVLVESSGNVASEVSEDGRSLDYVEID